MVMMLLRRERWSDAVAGMVTLRPCPGVCEAQILWCPEPARETLNPARRARLSSSVVVLGMEPVVVPPEVRRVSWVLVVGVLCAVSAADCFLRRVFSDSGGMVLRGCYDSPAGEAVDGVL